MKYVCPRDQKPLFWRDFLLNGRWHCRHCSGVLALEKHLLKIPALSEFVGALNDSPDPGRLKCPSCYKVMRPKNFSAEHKAAQIDLCESCRYYWFDPGELKRLQDSLTQSEAITLPSAPGRFLIFNAYEEYEKARANSVINFVRVVSAVVLLFNWWVYIKTKPFGHEYSYGANFVTKPRAGPPHANAQIAMYLSVVSLILPRHLGPIIVIALWFTFMAVIIWVSRF